MRRSQALRGKYVRGKGLGRPRQPCTGDAGDACQTHHLYQGDVQLEPPKRPVTPQSVTFKPVTPQSVTPQSDTPQPVTTLAPKRYNKPCLQVADRVFPWNEPCTLEVTEVGVKAEFGVLGKTSLKLVNLGCTVIRYSWQHQAHRDVFQTGRYRTSPFQFDCHDGVILPHDSAILALHFRSEVPGVWCEYWHLYTIPRLGPACRGNILVAFWGIALDIDRNRLARQGIDEELEQLAAERDIARCVQDLVACLPLEKQSDDQKEAEREVIQNTVPDDVRIFESQNPGLIYRSHAMQTLFEICRYQRRFSGFDSVKKKVGKHWTNVKGINKLQRLAVLMSAITSPITKNKKRRSSTVDHHGHSRSKPDRRQTKRLPDDPENIHMTRAGVKVKELRQNLRWVPESYDELMLKKLDNAVSEMSHPQTVALHIDWRSFVCKLGLSQALDAIAQAECKLLLSLCLLEESKAKSQRTTTSRDTTGAKDSRYGSSSSLLYLAVPGTIPCRTMSLGERPSGLQDIREVSQECLLTLSQECWVKRDAFGLPRFVDLSDELQAQYDTKLNDVVYSLLARMVETVFPSGGAMVDMMGRIIHPPE
ncbi:hypothetical protein BaRGS_00024848 [Batillaria attramentaria]|uniref:Uncharacterized protein n=1 Tax=Batillaria attramentaria TaxID=370345 RepID=A0ABD0KA57_9CAEN